ncbi:hypothetical protein MBLNU459_g6430t1 [Dothideomycetes sp. NU459]
MAISGLGQSASVAAMVSECSSSIRQFTEPAEPQLHTLSAARSQDQQTARAAADPAPCGRHCLGLAQRDDRGRAKIRMRERRTGDECPHTAHSPVLSPGLSVDPSKAHAHTRTHQRRRQQQPEQQQQQQQQQQEKKQQQQQQQQQQRAVPLGVHLSAPSQ